MYCDNCGAKVSDRSPFCPYCGYEFSGRKANPARKERRQMILIWLVRFALVATFLLLAFLGVGALGVYQGLRERDRLTQEAAAEHYSLGLAHLEKGEYELALAEFELVLRLVPDYRDTRDRVEEIKAKLQTQATPTSEVRSQAADLLYAQAQTFYEEKKWEEAALKLEQLRNLDPDYKPQAVRELLFSTYRQWGLELVNKDRMEEAIHYLDKALELRADDEVAAQRKLAALYLNAISYWGADWERAIEAFNELYRLEPGYKDVEQRLHDAYVHYGDLLANRGQWCLAQEQYAMAVRIKPDQAIEDKRIDANRLCLAVTPTPAITGTVPSPAHIAGFEIGKIAFSLYNAERQTYDLFVVYANGLRWVKVASSGDQPSFSPDGKHIAFHSLSGPRSGLRIVSIEGSEALKLAVPKGAVHPTWSPDGKRIAFAVREDDGWHIYAIPADGQGEPEELARGWSPAWGPDGRLAYTGCDKGEENCGIHFTEQDLSHPLRITADPHDICLAWSPDGTKLAYMSDHDGNWEVYVVALTGQVWRLTMNEANDGLPAWSPDGQHIAFVSDRDGTWGLYLMNPDGSEQRKILDLGAEYPNWLDERISWAK